MLYGLLAASPHVQNGRGRTVLLYLYKEIIYLHTQFQRKTTLEFNDGELCEGDYDWPRVALKPER